MYSPDVQAPTAAETPKSVRLVRWMVALGVYVILCVALIWWLSLPPPLKAPLAIIPLPDGTELRLLSFRITEEIELYHHDDFGERLITPEYYNRGYGRTSWGRLGSSGVSSPWFVFSRYEPRKKRFHIPPLQDFRILEDGTGLEFTAKVFHGSNEFPVSVAAFAAFPRREPTLTVQFRHDGQIVTAKIPNPIVSQATPFTATALPQRLEVDGFAFDLRGVKLTRSKKVISSQVPNYQPTPDLKVSALNAPKAQLSTRWSFFDATGNESGHEMLPASENVWGLKVTAHEFTDFPFPPEQIKSLGKIKVPGPGQIVPLQLDPSLAEYGVVAVFGIGGGSYSLSYGAKGVSQIFHNSGTGMMTPVGTVSLKRPFGASTSTQHFAVWAFIETRGKKQHSGEVRILHGADSLHNNGGGSSSDGRAEARAYSFDGMATKLPVGDEIELQFVYPKERNVKFYFERPKLPSEKKATGAGAGESTK